MTTTRRGRPPSGGREQILEATFDLLREKGVARLTTKEIATRAGVSEGSIFYHYKDRSGLLNAVFEEGLQPLTEFREQGTGTGELRETLDRFTAAVERFLEHSLIVLFAAQADEELRTGVVDNMRRNDWGPHHGLLVIGNYLKFLQSEGRVKADLDASTAAFTLLSCCMMRVSHPKLLGHSHGVPSRAEVLDTFVAMVAAEPQVRA